MSTRKKLIGTRNESSLHRTLKYSYAGNEGETEAIVGEYVADVISADGEYIEVQIGSFAPLKKKVKEFAAAGKVRIIHPIAAQKYIETYKPGRRRKSLGALLHRRKSPLKGSPWKLFDALMYAPELPLIRGLAIEIVMAEITEKRVKDGKGAWRRKGISIFDRELAAWYESILLEKPADYLRFVPYKKKQAFTGSMLAETAGIDTDTARKALYVLTKMGIVKRTGKKGNSWIYVRKK
ncbi:MAG: replication protein [Treponema sp.]|nr:replication protein [Treponema sp.]